MKIRGSFRKFCLLRPIKYSLFCYIFFHLRIMLRVIWKCSIIEEVLFVLEMTASVSLFVKNLVNILTCSPVIML